MDVSPEVLRDVEFREQWRGYSPDEVDNYLERLAMVIEQLEQRLRAADERTARAEARAQESSGAERDLRRTLVLAQRTADAAIAEAQAEATRTTTEADRHALEVTAEAERRATDLVADAERRATELVTDAEQQAAALLVEGRRRAIDEEAEARRLLREEVEALHAARGALQSDVEALTAYLDAERSRATADLERQLEWLRAPARALPTPPKSSGAAVPPAAPVTVDGLPATAAVPAIGAGGEAPAGAGHLADTGATAAVALGPGGDHDDAADDAAFADDPVAGLVEQLGDRVAAEPVLDAASSVDAAADDGAAVVPGATDHEPAEPGAEAVVVDAAPTDVDRDDGADTGVEPDRDVEPDLVQADLVETDLVETEAGVDLDLDAEAARPDADHEAHAAVDAPAGPEHDTGEHAAIGDDIPWADDRASARGAGGLFDDAAAEVPPYADDKYTAELRTAFDDDGAPTDEDRLLFGRPDDADPYDDAGRFWRRRR